MEDTFYLQEGSIEAESVDGFQYDEITVDDEFSITGTDIDEDLETALHTAQEKDSLNSFEEKSAVSSIVTRTRPEVTEDFVRNFLVRMNMVKTLDTFQTEWYEFKEKGMLKEEDTSNVPDVYIRNRQLDELVNHLKDELQSFKNAAQKAKDTHLKLRKERDFHRMHHKRVVQEKDKLLNEIKRMKQHYENYEPTLKALRQKYETAMKEKMLTKLERDRALAQIEGIQTSQAQNQNFTEKQAKQPKYVPITPNYDTQDNFQYSSEISPTKHPKDSEFPADKGVNPMLAKQKITCPHVSRSGGFRLTNSIQGHSLGISGFALHPRKQILATVSDDKTWKLWALLEGELIMTGEGHTEWLSDCDFSPSGTQLVTTSGDSTVKIWDFAEERCIVTFNDHTHAVWGCSWHHTGDFIATCANDGISKIWDLNSLRCRTTLRGHADSVNSVQFLAYSNTLCTCSADKTISLWDARTGLCAQTLYGHMHSVNHATFNMQGDVLASADAYGHVYLWDIRTCSISSKIDLGPHAINKIAFDPGSSVVACASNDGLVKIYEIENEQVTTLTGHEDAVQTVIFDRQGEFMLSGGSDSLVKVWS